MPLSEPPTILCADMSQHNQSVTVTIIATSTFVEIPSGYTGGAENVAFVFQNSKELKCLEPGLYLVNWNISLNLASNANNNIIGGVFQNGSTVFRTTSHGKIAAANDLINISGVGVVRFEFDDLASSALANLDATNDFVVEHAAITLAKLN